MLQVDTNFASPGFFSTILSRPEVPNQCYPQTTEIRYGTAEYIVSHSQNGKQINKIKQFGIGIPERIPQK